MLEERERIGKELHDGVIQSLFAVGMSLQGLASSTADAEVARRLEAAVEDVDRAIRDLRNYIFGLRPGILADRQLDQALKEMASEFDARTGIVTVVDVDGEAASVLASRAGDVVQLAREALSNVSRHAEATTCRVSLLRGRRRPRPRDRRRRPRVRHRNDDAGAWVSATSGNGPSRSVGCSQVESTPGEGTTVRATLPA